MTLRQATLGHAVDLEVTRNVVCRSKLPVNLVDISEMSCYSNSCDADMPSRDRAETPACENAHGLDDKV